MKCPVCPFADIPEGVKRCPNCDTDLTAVLRANEVAVAEFNNAVVLAQAGALDAALLRAATAVSLDERFAPARTLLGKLLWRKGQFAEAVSQWEQTAAVDPGSRTIAELLRSSRTKMRRRLALKAAAGVMALALIAAVAAMPFVSARSAAARIGDSVKAAMAERGTAPGPADAAYAQLAASLSDATLKLSAMDADLKAMTAQLSEREAAWREAGRSAELREQRLAEARETEHADFVRANSSSAAAMEDLRRELRLVREQSGAREQLARDSMLQILSLLRPADADRLSEQLEALARERDRLRVDEAGYANKARMYLLDRIRLERVRRRLAVCLRSIEECQAKYKATMAPWEQSMALLQAEPLSGGMSPVSDPPDPDNEDDNPGNTSADGNCSGR